MAPGPSGLGITLRGRATCAERAAESASPAAGTPFSAAAEAALDTTGAAASTAGLVALTTISAASEASLATEVAVSATVDAVPNVVSTALPKADFSESALSAATRARRGTDACRAPGASATSPGCGDAI